MTFSGHSRSLEMSQLNTAHMISYYHSIVTMALSCIVTHIANVGRKSQHLYTAPVFSAAVAGDPIRILQRC